ncbi:OmpA family protein [Dyella caseinilytica]|uniref:OmpA family protein n=1 Tax=Dyella caseinilytica TaxID=1849581 RepID=A0ABX7GXD3_9GAMM|nr:OmpA family protein [Dyella caseinilytica]QRN54372.1 OmpA family protein [Dyella caseinilytica]GFZ93690.1 OmpA/MotB domain-containing protein [Dyella caseinilytica]
MKRRRFELLCFAFSAFASLAVIADAPQHDLAGAHDNPIVSRFAGSVIVGYKAVDFDSLTVPLAPFDNGAFGKSETAQGHITRIAYAAPAGKSVFEIASNFEQALQHAGFQKRYMCNSTSGNSGCGNGAAMSAALMPEALVHSLSPNTADENTMIDTLWSNGGPVFVESARLDRPEGPVDVVLFINGNEGKPAGIYLQICEGKAMAAGEVTVDAKAMAQGLSQQGHIALYGIHFGTDSAVLSADSTPTLQQMAALMKSRPTLKVYIVGHTDNTGTLEHNLALSTQRAESVVKALQALGIAPSQMSAKGLASFAPIASNTTDDGKTKNRRVELVEQ